MAVSLAELQLHNDGPILAQYARENEHTGRAYRDPETGVQYPSVTTVLKNTPKGDMMRWAARMVAERARDRPDIVLGDPDKVVDRLQYAPSDYRDERGWVGSGVHKSVEAQLRGIWWEDPEFTPEQERIMESFDMFLDAYEVEPVLNETTVLVPCGDRGAVMGTLDGVWWVRDRYAESKPRLTLVDLKTSKSIWPEHEYQLSALYNASHWFEMVEEGAEGALLHKHPKLGKTWWLKREFDFDIRDVRILHLTELGYGWEKVADLEDNFEIYKDYVSLWGNLRRLADQRKSREFG